MGIFSHRAAAVSELEGVDLRLAVRRLLDDALAQDQELLRHLSPEERLAQTLARAAVAEHVDRIWEDAQARGVHPADHGGEWAAVASLRDLTCGLVEHAREARFLAGDDVDAEPA